MRLPRVVVVAFVLSLPLFMGAYVDTCDCGTFGGGAGTGSSSGSGTGSGAPMNGLFTEAVTEVAFEIDYEPGAEPYTGSELIFGDLWDLFETNAAALFAEHPKTLTIPRTLPEMEQLPASGKSTFTVGDILDIADAHRGIHDSGARRTFYILFLDGRFEDQDGVNPNVLGVSIGHTGVIAMFKPVIAGTGTARKKVEQTTLVHEFGHAVGLVDNGVPQLATHRDDPHGAHCDNPDCVMYWLNESGSDLAGFVLENVLGSQDVLFDQHCLDDVDGAAQ